MRFHTSSTLEQDVRSMDWRYQPGSSGDLETPLRDYKKMIDANDRCLIVEDNFFIFLAMEDIVTSFGFKFIDRASTLAEAKAHLKNTHYRLVMLDFQLGVLNNMPLAASLEKNKIPFAVTTGYSVDDVMERALKGAPVISKPYVTEKVNRTIESLLSLEPID